MRGISAGIVGIGNAAAKAFKLVSVGGGLALAAFTAGAIGALRLGGELDDLSNRTGQTVGNVLILRKAFQLAGLGADSVGTLTNRLQKSLSGVNEKGESTRELFAALGLNLEKLKGTDAVSQFQAIGDAINRLPNAADRTAVAMQIFGKSGGEVLQLFRDPNTFNQATESLGRQTGILQRNAAFFGAIEDKADRIKDKIQGFFVGVDDRIGLRLYALLDKLGSFDLTKLGQSFGDGINKGIDALYGFFADPKKITAFLVNGFTYAALSAGNVLVGVFRLVQDGFKNGLVNAVEGIGDVLLGTLTKALDPFLARFQAGIQFAVQSLPSSVTGVDYQDQDKIDRLQSKIDAGKAMLANPDSESYASRALHAATGTNVVTDIRDAQTKLSEELSKTKRGTMSELIAENLKRGTQLQIGSDSLSADQVIKSGIGLVNQAGSNAADYSKGFHVDDVLGAKQYGSAAAAIFNQAAKDGIKSEPQPGRMLNSHGLPFSDAELAQKIQLFGRQEAYKQVFGAAGDKMFQGATQRTPEQQAQSKANYAALYGQTAAEAKDKQGFDFHSFLAGKTSGQGTAAFPNLAPSYGSLPVAGNGPLNTTLGGGRGIIGIGGALDGNDTSLSTGGLGGSATSTIKNGFDGNAFFAATGQIHGYSSARRLAADAAKAGLNKKDPALAAAQSTAGNTAKIARALGQTGTTE